MYLKILKYCAYSEYSLRKPTPRAGCSTPLMRARKRARITPLNHAAFDAAQDTAGFLGCKYVLLNSMKIKNLLPLFVFFNVYEKKMGFAKCPKDAQVEEAND